MWRLRRVWGAWPSGRRPPSGWKLVRRLRTLVIVVVVFGLASTSVSAAQELDHRIEEAESEVDHLRDDVSAALRSLEDLGAAIDRAERELLAAQGRVREANRALAGLKERIEDAEAARDRAERNHDRAMGELEHADAEVATALDRLDEADARLHRRAIEVYKYGAGVTQQTLVTGVVGASDWHEVAVTTRSVSRIVGNDKDLLDSAMATRADALLAEEQAALARVEAADAEARAIAEAEELQVLIDEQHAAIEAVEHEQQRREQVLRSFEEDEELMAELAAKLQSEIDAARSNAARLRQEEADRAERAEREAQHERERQEQEDAVAADDAAGGNGGGGNGVGGGEEPPTPQPPSDLAWASKLPAAGQQWVQPVHDAASANGVDPRLMAALVWSESGFNPNAVSHVGAIGLAQLMPGTAAQLGVDAWDPRQNLDGGSRYLAAQINRFGSVELGLAAYNAGPNAVAAAGPGIPNYPETRFYVYIVMQRYNQLAS